MQKIKFKSPLKQINGKQQTEIVSTPECNNSDLRVS